MSGSLSRVLVMLMTRHGDARAGAGAAVGLPDVGASRLVEQLQLAQRVRQADLGEQVADDAAAALEHAEDVARRHRLPRRQRIELRRGCRFVAAAQSFGTTGS